MIGRADPTTLVPSGFSISIHHIASAGSGFGATGDLVERVRHTPYGEGRHSWFDDVDGDGDADSADLSVISAAQNKEIGQSGYVVDADINRSGKITLADSALYAAKSALNAGFISEGGAGAPDSPVGWCGYLYNFEAEAYLSRARWQSPRLGRWLERDPLGFVDGSGLYEYCRSNPVTLADPSGLGAGGKGPEQINLVELSRTTGLCGQFGVSWNFELDRPATESGWIVQLIELHPAYFACDGSPIQHHEVLRFFETAKEGTLGTGSNWGIAKGNQRTRNNNPGTFTPDDRFALTSRGQSYGSIRATGVARFFPSRLLDQGAPIHREEWGQFIANTNYSDAPWSTNQVWIPQDMGGLDPSFWNAFPTIVEGYHEITSSWDCRQSPSPTSLEVIPP